MDLIVSETVLKCYDIVNIKWDRYVKKMHQLKRNKKQVKSNNYIVA